MLKRTSSHCFFFSKQNICRTYLRFFGRAEKQQPRRQRRDIFRAEGAAKADKHALRVLGGMVRQLLPLRIRQINMSFKSLVIGK